MRYEDAKAVVDRNVAKIREALKAACEAETPEDVTKHLKVARVQAGRLYTEMGNDLQAAKGGQDPVEAREARQAEKAEKKAAREQRKAERAAAKEAAKAAAQAGSEVAVG